jgi:predicted permease
MTNPLSIFVEVILPLALVWGVGCLARRLLKLDAQPFARAGLYLLTPAVIFVNLMDSKLTAAESGRIVLVVVLLCAALWLIAWGQTHLLRLSPADSSAFLLTSVFINAVNYGFPAILLALGQEGLERAAVFAVAHALLSNTAGGFIAARGRAGGIKQTLLQVLRIPMLYAVALAVVLRLLGVSLSEPFFVAGVRIGLLPALYQAVRLLAQAAVPVFMLVLGMQLGGNGGKEGDDGRLPVGLMVLAGVNRLIVSPLLAWGLVSVLGLTGVAGRATIMEAAMPSAVLMVILAIEFDARPRFVSAVVVGTTLASMVTLTLLLSLWGVGG